MPAYYNEIDPYAAQWLRNLIARGEIAPGDVDERSISDVRPSDLAGYTQCHFFAGVGVWSLALRGAGWPDERQVWTGSCPWQPFSAAGKGDGFADERHLWPHWDWLIQKLGPPVLFGEQVASKDADPWVDLVHADLETMGYAFGCVPFPAAGVGAPHIRDRTYRVADRDCELQHGSRDAGQGRRSEPSDRRPLGGMEHAGGPRSEVGIPESPQREVGFAGIPDDTGCEFSGAGQRPEVGGAAGGLSDATRGGRGEECAFGGRSRSGDREEGLTAGRSSSSSSSTRRLVGVDQPVERHGILQRGGQFSRLGCDQGAGPTECGPGPTNSIWGTADWLFCRDGKWRPVEPGTFPLAHGAASRVGRLRAYGNAIVAEAARQFIAAYLDGLDSRSGLIGHNGCPDDFEALLA